MTQFDEFFLNGILRQNTIFGPLCYATAATFTVAYIQALVCLKKTFKPSFAYPEMYDDFYSQGQKNLGLQSS